MEMWTEVRRRVLTGELSKRAACQEYGINWRTLGKMLAHAEPPGYRRRVKREKPILGPHLAWIHEVLEQDKEEPKKQHHTAQRIFDRLKAERGYTGGVTMVKAAVREWKDIRKEVFVPLSHPPDGPRKPGSQRSNPFKGIAFYGVAVPLSCDASQWTEALAMPLRTRGASCFVLGKPSPLVGPKSGDYLQLMSASDDPPYGHESNKESCLN
jgi:hypothetical protein